MVLLAGVSQALVTRVGPRPVMAVGLALITGGMLWYTQIPVEGSFVPHLLPGYLLVGVGMAFSFIPMSIAALAGVEPQEAGLASGLINSSQQIGGALGVAIVATVAFTHTKTLLASGDSRRRRSDERLRPRLLGARRHQRGHRSWPASLWCAGRSSSRRRLPSRFDGSGSSHPELSPRDVLLDGRGQWQDLLLLGFSRCRVFLDDVGLCSRSVEKPLLVCTDRLD